MRVVVAVNGGAGRMRRRSLLVWLASFFLVRLIKLTIILFDFLFGLTRSDLKTRN